MAEQIRSFWSHLCGIFGAIFGMIAGGTVVTIERADAYSGSADCSRGEGSYKTTVASGALIEYCYGGGWLCAQTDSGSGYITNNWSNYPRYYAYFKSCASGYYATKNFASGTELHTVISSVAGMIRTTATNPYVTGTTSCITHSGCMFNTSTYKAHGYSYSGAAFQCDPYDYEGYSESLDELGAKAGCVKCPSYGEYAAMSTSGTSTTISHCFMSANTEYSDEVDTGVATGRFIWTSDCYYDDTSVAAWDKACAALKGSGNCTMTLDDAGSAKVKVIPIVQSVTGLGLKEAKALVDSAPATIIEDFSCTAAECYKPYFEEKGASITITQDSSSSSGGTTGGGTTGGGTTATTIEEQVINIIAERMDISVAGITMNSTLYDDLGMDELDLLETVYDLENEFDVAIDEEFYVNWATVADIVYWIQENV